MSSAPRPQRGPAAEAVGFRLNEGPRRSPPPSVTLTYLGDGVVEVSGVGVFARHVTASVPPALAERFRGRPEWRVEGEQDRQGGAQGLLDRPG